MPIEPSATEYAAAYNDVQNLIAGQNQAAAQARVDADKAYQIAMVKMQTDQRNKETAAAVGPGQGDDTIKVPLPAFEDNTGMNIAPLPHQAGAMLDQLTNLGM